MPDTIDRDRIAKLADVIEDHPAEFAMNQWWTRLDGHTYPDGHEHEAVADLAEATTMCGTIACIAGWAVYLWPADTNGAGTFHSAGRRILGLDNFDAEELFGATDLDHHAAVDALRNIAAGMDVCAALDSVRDA